MRQLNLVHNVVPARQEVTPGDTISTAMGKYLVCKVGDNVEGAVYVCTNLTTNLDAVILAREVTGHEPATQEAREAFATVWAKLDDIEADGEE